MVRGHLLRGHLDICHKEGGQLELLGWVFHETERLTHVSVLVDSVEWVSDLELREDRPDVQKIFHQCRTASRCSIKVVAPAGSVELEDSRTVISFVAKQGEREIGNIDLLYCDPALETRTPPLPPQVLRERVRGTGARDSEFLQNGWRIYSDLRRVLDRHSRVEDFGRILDWGCGCGRVSRHFMNAVPHSSFFGCDIDSDAIDWMEQVYPTSRFDAIRPLPPTPYQNEFFDLVYGVSILTHLDEATQFRWLDELRRIITKDGVVAVSILDESSCPTELLPLVKAKGFFDEPSRQSADFAPFSDEDYYRATYHSKAYVMERWSKGFEILEYVEGGIVSHQSLVLMRRRDEGSSVDVSREVEWRGKTSALESLRIFYCLTWYRVRRLLGRLWRKLGWAREHP